MPGPVRRLCPALAAVAACAALAQGTATTAERADAVVVRLYRDFAWTQVMVPRRDQPEFIDQPKAVLERYLDESLAALIVADRECVRRTREICRLDFDPLFEAQDIGATDLEVGAPDASGAVKVTFSFPGNRTRKAVVHAVAKTARGWRITDIRYTSGHSLRRLLAP